MSFDAHGLEAEREAVPEPWLAAVGLRAVPFGPGDLLVGLFELWLRDAGAKLMGPEAEQRWLQTVRASASPPPPTLCFSLDGEDFEPGTHASDSRTNGSRKIPRHHVLEHLRVGDHPRGVGCALRR